MVRNLSNMAVIYAMHRNKPMSKRMYRKGDQQQMELGIQQQDVQAQGHQQQKELGIQQQDVQAQGGKQ